MTQKIIVIVLLVITLSLVSCNSNRVASGCPLFDTSVDQDTSPLEGSVLVWSWWRDKEREVLDDIFAQFMDIYPGVTIVHTFVPGEQGQLAEQYQSRSQLGLGPDLVIGASAWLPGLAEEGLIHDLSNCNIDTSNNLSTALDTLRYQPSTADKEGLYGIPLSMHTTALYYNKELLGDATPPETLEELMIQLSTRGHKIALGTDFFHAFWGISAFGGQFLDNDGRLALNRGGFANWLDWLKGIQAMPNAVLARNFPDIVLYEMFTKGEVTFYVGRTDELLVIQSALGEDVVGVAPLPANGAYASGPLLQAESLFFNTAAATEQKRIGFRLAQFLTSTEQQRKFITNKISRIPANTQVRVDPQVYPAWAGFVAQTKTAVPFPSITKANDIIWLGEGNEVYVQALEGVITVDEAVDRFTNKLVSKYDFELAEPIVEASCELEGSIEVWHRWAGIDEAILQELARNFTARCSGTSVNLVAAASDDLYERYQRDTRLGDGPDLLIGPGQWIGSLAPEDLIRSIDTSADSSLRQSFANRSLQATIYNGQLYGLPESLDLLALYYKRDEVSDPARDVDDLAKQATPERPVAIPIKYYDGFWGLIAFGAISFSDTYQFIYEQENFLEWIQWLMRGQEDSRFVLSRDLTEVRNAFVEGPAVYLLGPASLIKDLRDNVGAERLRAVNLPSGPINPSGQFLRVEALMFNPNSDEVQARIAFEFARYLTSLEAQTLLTEQARHIPVHTQVRVNRADYPLVHTFMEQAKSSFPLVNHPEMESFWQLGETIYVDVFEKQQEPAEIITPYLEALSNNTTLQEALDSNQ